MLGFGVWESGYYAWLKREPCQRAAEDATLKAKIVSLWQQFRRVYGAPRLFEELRDQGIRTSIKRVARLMREAGIQGKMPRRKRPRTTQSDNAHPVAPNLLNRQFKGKKRNEVWLTDITYIETEEGYLFPTHNSARVAIFSYIMGFYNRIRRHSALRYQAPLSHAA